MKTLLIMATLMALKVATAYGQCTVTTYPDVWFFNYTGDQHRGGVLAYGQGDYVQGGALTSGGRDVNGNPYPGLPPCSWNTLWNESMGDALILENITQICNGINYTMGSVEESYRSDGYPDHIEQTGLAWGSNPGDGATPAYVDQIEAGSLLGNGNNSGKYGRANVITNRTGYCKGVEF